MTDTASDIAALPDKSLLLLDDDAALRTRLGRALEQRGFETELASSVRSHKRGARQAAGLRRSRHAP